VPAFVGLLHHAEIHAFTSEVPAPWMLKPRTEASSTGIRKIHTPEQLWKEIEALGDRASHFLLERYLPGAVHHVDSIVIDGEVVFSEVHRNGIPPFDVSHGGGVFSTFTVERGSPDEQALQELNRKVLERFGLRRGVTHLEYIQGSEDGRMYFLEAGARVGGAHVADVVEAATGINLWAELADIEIDRDAAPYRLPPRRAEYGGLVQSLARSERPDLSAYNDPEVTGTIEDRYHAGIVVRSPEPRRVRELLDAYARRFAHDFLAVMPHYELPPQR
jgi:biotin carboxylase